MHLFTYLLPAVPVTGNNFFNMHTIIYSLSLIFCKPFTDIIMLIMAPCQGGKVESPTQRQQTKFTCNFSTSISVRKFFTNYCFNFFIYQLLLRFIQTQIHVELTIVERLEMIVINYTYQNSKHDNISSYKSQTMDFRLLFFLALTTN